MPAEERAPEPVAATEASARVSHFRRWYLRPWFLLLLAILLPLGACAYSLGMRARAAEIIDASGLDSGYSTPDWFQPIEEYLTFLPAACYQRLEWIIVDLSDPATADDLLRQLRWFPELTVLTLVGSAKEEDETSVSGEEPHIPVPEPVNCDLSCYVHLEDLSLYGVRLSERSLEQLSRCPHLRSLTLGDSGLTLPMAQKLGQLRSLRYLVITNCELTDELLNQIGGLNQLESFSIDEPAITDKGLQVLRHFPRLQQLTLSNVTLTGQGISLLNRLPLEELDLEPVCASDADFAALSVPMPTLRLIRIVMPVTDAALDTVAYHPNLRVIRIDSGAVQIDAATRLRGLTQLESLRINGTRIKLPIAAVPNETE